MLGLFARAARRWFGMGDIDLLGTVPNGQLGILLPRRMFPVVTSRAVLGGQDLGEPVCARENPAIGALRLPARPVFALGTGYFAAAHA